LGEVIGEKSGSFFVFGNNENKQSNQTIKELDHKTQGNYNLGLN